MQKGFIDILAIARENVRNNPSIVNEDTYKASKRYLQGLMDEVEEVEPEIKENNEVHLVDELGDIAWDYAVLVALLEYRGLITNAEEVLDHAHAKYTERAPAFLKETDELWDEVKSSQKEQLKQRHLEKYG